MRWCAVGLALACASPFASPAAQPAGGAPPPGASYEGRAFDFKPVADGVWFATGTGVVSAESNSAIIDLGDGLLVVDAQTSPAAAWALLHELPRVSTKPVRWLVVTHMHYDHAHGTQSFPAGITVIGTPYTREMLATGQTLTHPTAQGNRRFSATRIAALSAAMDSAPNAAAKAKLAAERRTWEQYLMSLGTLQPVPPNVTVATRMSLFGGGREVQVVNPGPAHTPGDLVVWLPKERVLVTGDLLQPGAPYMGDGTLDHWAVVLDSLVALKPAMVLPGHGEALANPALGPTLSAYLKAIWTQSVAARAKGLSVEQAAAALELSAFDQYYPRPPGWTDAMVVNRRVGAVKRVYQLLDERK